jgi:hypothetical protein
MQAEIGLGDFLPRDIRRWPVKHDATFEHADDTMRDRHGATKILFD